MIGNNFKKCLKKETDCVILNLVRKIEKKEAKK